MKTLRVCGLALASLTLSLTGTGCGLVLGLGDFKEGPAGGGGTGGGGGGSPASCTNAIKDGSETDKDCGGVCSPCVDGQGCSVGSDCASKVCSAGTCIAPACDDKIANGSETDKDCGGSCSACGPGQGCAVEQDCKGQQCEAGKCVSTCSDHVKGGKETDVDCGGSECSPCADGGGCATSTDCASAVCHASLCAEPYVWAERFGSPNAMGSTTTLAIAIDGSGNAALVGTISGTADFGGGTLTTSGATDMFIAKVNAAGKHVWSQLLASPKDESLTGVAFDPTGNVFVSGDFSGPMFIGGTSLPSSGGGDMLVAKLDPAGAVLWVKRFGDAQTQDAAGVAADGAGNVFMAGTFNGTVNFGGAPLTTTSAFDDDVFLTKLGPAGEHLWSKRFGDDTSQIGSAVAANAAGNVAITGDFHGVLDFGTTPLSSPADYIYVASFDPSGNPLWSKSFGTSNNNQGTSVAVGATGDVVITGSFTGTIDFGGGEFTSAGHPDAFLARFDSSGKALWSKHFTDTTGQFGSRGTSVAVDKAGNVILTGTFQGMVDFGGAPLIGAGERDYFVVKLDPSGKHLWSSRFGGIADQTRASVATYDAANILLAGDLTGSIDFGGGPLVSMTPNNNDTFLAKLLTP